MGKTYVAPHIQSEKCFETSALMCAKTPGETPPGAWHFSAPYDTFTGHMGSGWGGDESLTGSAGIGFGPGGTSASAGFYYGQCTIWITYSS
jgi:hypothetical protein